MTSVLTLEMDPDSQRWFEDLRQRHFPPERNQIPAHLTLFHTLGREPAISRQLQQTSATHQSFVMRVTGVRSLGRGVAYFLASRQLEAVHRELAEAFAGDLTPQDRHPLRPHVVVQNKVSPETARALLQQLNASFEPREVLATGLLLWHYLGGPWELAERHPFTPAGSAGAAPRITMKP